MNIFVANISFQSSEEDLKELFEQHGIVKSVKIITDRESGRSKGYGFVEMENDDEAQCAVDALNLQDFKGRPLGVNEAKPRERAY